MFKGNWTISGHFHKQSVSKNQRVNTCKYVELWTLDLETKNIPIPHRKVATSLPIALNTWNPRVSCPSYSGLKRSPSRKTPPGHQVGVALNAPHFPQASNSVVPRATAGRTQHILKHLMQCGGKQRWTWSECLGLFFRICGTKLQCDAGWFTTAYAWWTGIAGCLLVRSKPISGVQNPRSACLI